MRQRPRCDMTRVIISVKENEYDISVCGHADKVNTGEGNILCAAVSVLIQTLMQMFEDMEEKGVIHYKKNISDGYVRLVCSVNAEFKDYVKGALDTIETGFLLLQERYQKNIVVVGEGNFGICYDADKDAWERPQEGKSYEEKYIKD